MAREAPTKATIRTLFARSGNQCAYPGCSLELLDSKDNLLGEVCHIKAASPGGPRFDATQSDEERRGPENLLLLCRHHHRMIDVDPDGWSVEQLRALKQTHEASVNLSVFSPSQAAVANVVQQIEQYWSGLAVAHASHIAPNLRVPIEVTSTFDALMGTADELIEGLYQCAVHLGEHDARIPQDLRKHLVKAGLKPADVEAAVACQSPLYLRNWETSALAIPNFSTHLHAVLLQLHVLHLEELQKRKPDDQVIHEGLADARERLTNMATHGGLTD